MSMTPQFITVDGAKSPLKTSAGLPAGECCCEPSTCCLYPAVPPVAYYDLPDVVYSSGAMDFMYRDGVKYTSGVFELSIIDGMWKLLRTPGEPEEEVYYETFCLIDNMNTLDQFEGTYEVPRIYGLPKSFGCHTFTTDSSVTVIRESLCLYKATVSGTTFTDYYESSGPDDPCLDPSVIEVTVSLSYVGTNWMLLFSDASGAVMLASSNTRDQSSPDGPYGLITVT